MTEMISKAVVLDDHPPRIELLPKADPRFTFCGIECVTDLSVPRDEIRLIDNGKVVGIIKVRIPEGSK